MGPLTPSSQEEVVVKGMEELLQTAFLSLQYQPRTSPPDRIPFAPERAVMYLSTNIPVTVTNKDRCIEVWNANYYRQISVFRVPWFHSTTARTFSESPDFLRLRGDICDWQGGIISVMKAPPAMIDITHSGFEPKSLSKVIGRGGGELPGYCTNGTMRHVTIPAITLPYGLGRFGGSELSTLRPKKAVPCFAGPNSNDTLFDWGQIEAQPLWVPALNSYYSCPFPIDTFKKRGFSTSGLLKVSRASKRQRFYHEHRPKGSKGQLHFGRASTIQKERMDSPHRPSHPKPTKLAVKDGHFSANAKQPTGAPPVLPSLLVMSIIVSQVYRF
ncbi:hypothetical protein FA15DRAFT_692143 [Coprinopsis marcescibilis]|uniref:Uncharacterized protein n=1 Tax=Coprinopsis marcescibilis TaxID=230819 RepID=A0A5C3L5S7_COPMA|nr:hypothetical protein FA15DRAFT_692143 [Coprinopsis marcescibilis]